MTPTQCWLGSLVASVLLLEDLVKSFSSTADGCITVLAYIIFGRAPPGWELSHCPSAITRGAGRGRGWKRHLALSVVRSNPKRAGQAGGAETIHSAAPQLPEAGALLQSSSSAGPGAQTLQGVKPGWQEEGLGTVQVSWFILRKREGGVRIWAIHYLPERQKHHNGSVWLTYK